MGGAMVEAALDTVRPTAQVAAVELHFVNEALVPMVMGDPARLQQIVWNLLSNALKFTPAGGRVTVTLSAKDNAAVISVRDTGVGIAPEFLPHVFERFTQADGSTTRRYGGLGLGLAIVRHLVEQHGGTITATSEGAGRGACFSITLPLLQEEFASGEAADAHAESAEDAQLEGVKVLLVDDEPDVLDLLTRVLADSGAEVHGFRGPLAALEAYPALSPDVVISDIGMPGVDGYEFLGRVRRLQAAKGGPVPMIALSAFARSEDERRALQRRFDMYLTKPVQPSVLLKSVATVAQNRTRESAT